MNWKFLPAAVPAAVAAMLLILGGCSSSRPDAASRSRQTPEPADIAALRRDNETLRQDLAQSQRQMEALTKQVATERDEQRRFREMMSTNFDLLEQSVSTTLAKAIDRAPPTPPSGPAAVPAGPMAASAQGNVTIPGSLTAGNATKPEARTAQAEPRPSPSPGIAVAPMTGRPLAPAQGHNTVATAGQKGRAVAPTAAMVVPPQKPGAADAGVMMAGNKPYADPDLTEPANPKQLTANRAAKPLYEKGFVLFGNRQYEQSILVYQNFLSRYPEDIYSDNAQFWIGEAYLRMDKLTEAETAYRKVLREYAHKSTLEGYKTPDAIYRIGQIYAKRNNEKLARYYLQHVVQRFPDSSAGRKAARDLESIGPLTSQMADKSVAGG